MCGEHLPDRLGDGVRPRLAPDLGGLATRVRDQDPAHTDLVDAEAVEVGQPFAVGGFPLGTARQARVGQPHLDVGEPVEAFAFDGEQVAAGTLAPRGEPLLPRLLGDGPVRQQLEAASRRQVGGGVTDDGLHQAVGGEGGFAVGEALTTGWAHHVGRVGDDQVEPLPRHRFVQRPLPEVDIHAAQRRPEACEPQGARVEVGGDHPVGVAGQVVALHPASRAEVEGPPDVTSHGDLREGQGRG